MNPQEVLGRALEGFPVSAPYPASSRLIQKNLLKILEAKTRLEFLSQQFSSSPTSGTTLDGRGAWLAWFLVRLDNASFIPFINISLSRQHQRMDPG